MCLQNVELCVAVVVADREPHAGLRVSPIVVRGAAFERDVVERAIVVVAVQDRGGRIRCDVDVGPVVAGEIRGCRSHRVAARDTRDARRLGPILERAVAAIAEEQVGVGRQPFRATVHRQAFPQAVRTLAGLGRGIEVEPQVVGDEEIEAAVAVVVDKRAAGAPAHVAPAEPGGRRHVLEPCTAVVAIQDVVTVVREEHVEPAVIVDVAGADARGPSGAPQADLVGHVDERAIARVAIQPIRRRFPGRKGRVTALALRESRPAEHERIEPAVAVVVDERHACAVGLDDEPFPIDASVDRRTGEAG